MRLYGKCKEEIFKLFIHVLFYSLLALLIVCMVYPYTSFYYKKPIIAPFALRLNVTSLVLEEGETDRIYVVGITRKAVFICDNFRVVEVNQRGYIRARRKGRTVIKVKVHGKVLKCKVKVIKRKK